MILKKFIAGILSILIILSNISVISFAAENSPEIYLNGKKTEFANAPYLDNIKEILYKNNIYSNVKFRNGITDIYNLRDYYNHGDIYIDFSIEETYGQAKLEAISCGKPILMPNIGNNKYLIHEKNNCLLCSDCYDMSIKAQQLLNDPYFYNEVSVLNREHIIKHYSYNRILKIIKEYI